MTLLQQLEELLGRVIGASTLNQIADDTKQLRIDSTAIRESQGLVFQAVMQTKESLDNLIANTPGSADLAAVKANLSLVLQYLGLEPISAEQQLIDDISQLSSELKAMVRGIDTTPPPNPQPSNP